MLVDVAWEEYDFIHYGLPQYPAPGGELPTLEYPSLLIRTTEQYINESTGGIEEAFTIDFLGSEQDYDGPFVFTPTTREIADFLYSTWGAVQIQPFDIYGLWGQIDVPEDWWETAIYKETNFYIVVPGNCFIQAKIQTPRLLSKDIDFDFEAGNVKGGGTGYSIEGTIYQPLPRTLTAQDISVEFNWGDYNHNFPFTTLPCTVIDSGLRGTGGEIIYNISDGLPNYSPEAYPVPYNSNFSLAGIVKANTFHDVATLQILYEGSVVHSPIYPLPARPVPRANHERDELDFDYSQGYWYTNSITGDNITLPFYYGPALLFPVTVIDDDPALIDGLNSFSNISSVAAVQWAVYRNGDLLYASSPLTPESSQLDFEFDPGITYSVFLMAKDADGVSFVIGFEMEVNGTPLTPVANRNGEVLFPISTGNVTNIVKVVEFLPGFVQGAIEATQVHLMRHEMTYYAGGKADGNFSLFRSDDEGATWEMISNFPAGYKVISWCELDHGGFAAIALGIGADRRKLYGAVTWDGVTWSEPTLQRNGGETTPRGSVRQLTASGESHLIVSDAQTYSIRVDDFFKEENPDA